jgi:hypothetical protein
MTALQLICKQVVDTMPSTHGGSSKRQQPHRPQMSAIARHKRSDLL